MEQKVHHYYVCYKPRNMVSQFVSPDHVPLLGALEYTFPEGTNAVGRLDKDSEGLLLLTTDKRIPRLLFESAQPHERTYLVAVLNAVTDADMEALSNGVNITVQGGVSYLAKPVAVKRVEHPEHFVKDTVPASPYIRYHWLAITLTEGKYHEVRKMVRAAGHPCRRLIRIRMVDLHLGIMAPGEVRELEPSEFFRLLHLEN